MTDYLHDFLIKSGKNIDDASTELINYVISVTESTEIELLNDPAFEETIVNIVANYQTQATEMIIDTLGNFLKFNSFIKIFFSVLN